MIKPGDFVKVYFDTLPWFSGRVVSLPQATGDCWVIDSEDGVHHVQNFSQIIREKPL